MFKKWLEASIYMYTIPKPAAGEITTWWRKVAGAHLPQPCCDFCIRSRSSSFLWWSHLHLFGEVVFTFCVRLFSFFGWDSLIFFGWSCLNFLVRLSSFFGEVVFIFGVKCSLYFGWGWLGAIGNRTSVYVLNLRHLFFLHFLYKFVFINTFIVL